jgi:hypothetical protein
VHPGDAGINKPFDRILKAFADEAPELFLRLLGLARLSHLGAFTASK